MLHQEEHDRTTCIQSELILNVTKNPLILHADNVQYTMMYSTFFCKMNQTPFLLPVHLQVNMHKQA